MNLLNTNIKETEIFRILKEKLKLQNFGFEFSFERKQEFVCSCGKHSKNITKKDKNNYEYNYGYYEHCPFCNSPLIPIEFDSCSVIFWEFKNSNTDEDILNMEFKPYALKCSEYGDVEIMDYEEDLKVSYNKNKESIKFFTEYYYEKDLYDYFYYLDYQIYDMFDGVLKETNGHDEILSYLKQYTEFPFDESYGNLELMLLDLYGYSQAPIYYDIKNNESGILDFSHQYDRVSLIDEQLKELEGLGIDTNYKTILESTGLEKKDIYNKFDLANIFILRKFKKLVEKYNLVDYIQHFYDLYEIDFNLFHKKMIIERSDKIDFQILIKSILCGITSQEDFKRRLSIFLSIEDNQLDFIEFNKPLSSSYPVMLFFQEKEIMSIETYKKVLQKPTLDNIYKLL